jgi:hypothetical protein
LDEECRPGQDDPGFREVNVREVRKVPKPPEIRELCVEVSSFELNCVLTRFLIPGLVHNLGGSTMRLVSTVIAVAAIAALTAPSFAMEKMDGDAWLKEIMHGKPGDMAQMAMQAMPAMAMPAMPTMPKGKMNMSKPASWTWPWKWPTSMK